MISYDAPKHPSRSVIIALVALALLHVCLAAWYASSTPYRTAGTLKYQRAQVPDVGAPDERQHANYVQGLLSGSGLPVFNPHDPNLIESYQSHHPPLYYFLAAGWGKISGVSDVAQPEGRRLRYLNTVLGALGVVGVFFLAYWGCGRRDVALVAAAFAALLPMNLALSGAISNDPLLIALCCWSLAFAALIYAKGISPARAATLGVLLGAAVLTKTTGIALLPAVLIGLLFAKFQYKKLAWVTVAVFALLAGPWWVRNQNLYGDPLAMKAFDQAFTGSASPADVALPSLVMSDNDLAGRFMTFQQSHPELQPRELVRAADKELGVNSARSPHYWSDWVGWWTLRSFIGTFGYMDLFLDDKLYRVALAVLLILAIGGLLSLRKPEFAPPKPVNWMLWTFLGVVVLLFVRFNLQYFQGQARYLLPALGPISILMSLGVLFFARDKWKLSFGALIALMLGLNLHILQWLPAEFASRIGTPLN